MDVLHLGRIKNAIDPGAIDINITPEIIGELKQSKIIFSNDLMENVGKTLLKTNNYNYEYLSVCESWNPEILNIDNDYKIVFLKSSNENKTFWSVIILIKINDSIFCYCNNEKVSKKKIAKYIKNNCPLFGENGLHALISLYKIILKNTTKTASIKQPYKKIVNKITEIDEKIENVNEGDYQQIKDIILKKLHQEMNSTIHQKVNFVSDNKKFVKEYEELVKIALEFQLIENFNKQYKEKLMEPGLKDKFHDSLKKVQNLLKNSNEEKFKYFSIEQKFPKEMKCIKTVFNIINNYNDKDKKNKKITEICEQLFTELTVTEVKKYFEDIPAATEDAGSSSNTNDNVINNVSIINKPNIQVEIDCNVKNLENLIHEIEEYEINKNYKLCKNNELKSKYSKFEKKWKGWEKKEIYDIKVWLKDLERRLRILDDPPSYYEALAVVNRAFELCIGHTLRLPQILALILFNQKSPDSGLLCQIQTGEGKTFVIAAIAILKILLDGVKTIDIITSNNVLARDAVSVTKNLYQLFDITVDINTELKSDQKACYNANVVYGSMSSFQFDFLNHDFNGLGTRLGRKFEYVILDEVDNMLIDNGGNIAKLAEVFPGMENLIYIYIEIWKDLNIFGKTFDKNSIADEDQIESKIDEWRKIIQGKIENNMESFIIPLHLMEYVKNVLPKWIDNAIYAKYDCIENINYIIQTESAEGGEQIIVPVDYTNTGVTLKNTMWSHGLHQFLQLKHNLQVHAENLTSCCISNYAYIRKYGTNLIGLTGTIGGEGEQDLLKAIYQVDFISLPTFKVKQFENYPEIIVPDIEWLDKITELCLFMLLQKRAVLVVCLTIADANDVYNELIQLKSTYIDLNPTIHKYLSENESHITDELIDSGTIIVATNIAGRGTDFKTTKQLEDHGGLHICVTFCPESKRIQDQVFYRTSRQGNKGSAGLILSKNQIANIMKNKENYKIEEIYKQIHDKEQYYMAYLKTFKSKELYFEDCLFNLFSNLYKQARTNNLNVFSRKDLKEYWAFWFENQELATEDIIFNKFEDIENEAKQLFESFENDEKVEEILKNHIKHNPYYDIHRAHSYISQQNLIKAEECLHNSLEMSKDTLSEAHYLLSEIAMERGGVLMTRIKNILKTVGIGYLIQTNKNLKDYKKNCMEHLEKARTILIKEIQFIENYLICDEFYKIFNGSLDKNLFIKHLNSKLICLKMYHENINQIYETIRNNLNKELIIKAKLDDVNQIHETIQKNDDNLIIARKHDDINQMQDTTQKYLIIKMKHDDNSLIQENTDTDLIISMKHYDFNQIHEPFQNSIDKDLIVIIIGDDLKQISGTIQINGDKKLIIIMKYDDINYINDIIQKNVGKNLKMIMKYNDNEMECELRSKQQFITKDATKNLKIRGFIGLYEVGEIQCTSNKIMAASATQIVLGVAVFGLGSFFPIVMPFAQMISVTLLSEGILDIVVMLIGGKLALDWNYFKSKLIAFGVTAISMGLFALSGFINKLITKARSLLSCVNQSLKMLGNFDCIINCVEEFLIKSKSLINMANKICLPNYVASKPLLSVLWQTTNRVLRKAIISNIIDIKYQQLFNEKWNNINETIRLLVDKEFFDKLNANILLILNCRKGYDIFLSKLESMNISKYIDKNDLKLMAEKFIIHTNLDTAMWFVAFLAMIDKIYPIIVKIIVQFLNQLKKEIEDAFKNIIGDKKGTGGHDPDYLQDSRIKITEKISKMLYDLYYHTIKKSRKHDNNDTSDKDDKEEIERILNQTDPYDVLNLNKQQIVTIEDLNKTFAELSLKYRPNNIDKELSDVFQKIQWAYTEIKNQLQ